MGYGILALLKGSFCVTLCINLEKSWKRLIVHIYMISPVAGLRHTPSLPTLLKVLLQVFESIVSTIVDRRAPHSRFPGSLMT